MLVTLVTVHVSCELIKAIGLLIVKRARLFSTTSAFNQRLLQIKLVNDVYVLYNYVLTCISSSLYISLSTPDKPLSFTVNNCNTW